MYIAICDDHIETAKDLQRKILSLPLDNIGGIDIFTSPDKLIFAAEDFHYDVVFMDIEPGSISSVNVNTHMYKNWNILMYNNGTTHLLRESPEAHACL